MLCISGKANLLCVLWLGRCYKAAGDTAAVQALFPLQQETDIHLKAAQLILLLNQDLDKAQVFQACMFTQRNCSCFCTELDAQVLSAFYF